MKGIQEKYIWNQIPLFRVLWPYILGVLIGIFYPFVVPAIASGLALSLIIIFILVFEKARKNWVVLLPVIVVLAGYCIAVLNTEGLNPNHYTQQDLDQTDWIVGTLQTDPIERSRSVKAELRLEHASHMRDTTALLGDVLIYFEKDERLKTLRYGDRLVLNGNLNEISGPKNPGEFDYRRYLKMHQIESQIYVSSGHWRLMEEGGGLRRWISDVQQKFISVLKSNTRSNRELAILSALLIGNKQFLSADQVSAFAGSGAMHVLAHAHAPQHHGALGRCERTRHFANSVGRDAANGRHGLWAVAFNVGDQRVVVFRAGGDEVGIDQIFFNDDVQHGIE